MKLCLLPWEAGAVLLWGEIPPQDQLRAVRRFRLRFPWASWATAEAWIATKCGKQKSEKQRQEEKKEAARALKAARVSNAAPAVAGRRTGPASVSNAGSVPTLTGPSTPIAPLPYPPTAAAIGSLASMGSGAYGSFFTPVASPNPFAYFPQAPVPSVCSISAAASQGLAFTALGTGFGHTRVYDDGMIDPDLCPASAAPDAEVPLFLPFDENEDDDDDEMMDDWPELFPEDLRDATAEDPIVNKVEEMNARDRQAAENVGLSLVGGEVLAVSQLPMPIPSASFVAAGADVFDAHGALGDVSEAGMDDVEIPTAVASDDMAAFVKDGRVFPSFSNFDN
ncbi:Protein of unknown function [Pyronema omphalodes CBS 100304]|uniref:Uncharacterized protein n=1 Tax=Pyronema omphalodes (strain CBS 100304) TaxID=1076935 RepID=U4L736_PYROM|nr:Protein of unknown function [Pyronema omphalodes CBS 100304]